MKTTARGQKLNSVSIDLGDGECRLEHVLSATGQEQLRLSLWSQGKMQRRPVSLSEQELIVLLQAAIRAGMLSRGFVGAFQSITEI
jgi:hypothetical protein